MNLFEAFESTLVDEGKEFPLSETSSITLLPVGGDKSQRAFENMMKPYATRLQAGSKLTDEENKALNVKFYANHIILGWKGMQDREGNEIPFTKDRAAELLADPKLQKFFALIIRMASNDAAFEAAQAEADEKN